MTLTGQYEAWLEELEKRLSARAGVLDIGCGVPVARRLAAAGHVVTGVDVSEVQVERARALGPDATFLRADVTDIDFPDGSFDAVVALYALIHMPLDRQPRLLRACSLAAPRRLVPGHCRADGPRPGTEP